MHCYRYNVKCSEIKLKMPIILILIFTEIYIHFGLFVLIQIMIWTLVFILSTFLSNIDPSNKQFPIIKILSIIVIFFILYYNSKEVSILSMFIIPLSVTKITFIDEIIGNEEVNPIDIIYIQNCHISWLHFVDFQDLSDLLSLLDDNKAYVVSFDLIFDKSGFSLGNPSLVLGKPILFSRNSNPWLLTNYLQERLRIAANSYFLDDSSLDKDGPSVLVKYKEINLYFK